MERETGSGRKLAHGADGIGGSRALVSGIEFVDAGLDEPDTDRKEKGCKKSTEVLPADGGLARFHNDESFGWKASRVSPADQADEKISQHCRGRNQPERWRPETKNPHATNGRTKYRSPKTKSRRHDGVEE